MKNIFIIINEISSVKCKNCFVSEERLLYYDEEYIMSLDLSLKD